MGRFPERTEILGDAGAEGEMHKEALQPSGLVVGQRAHPLALRLLPFRVQTLTALRIREHLALL